MSSSGWKSGVRFLAVGGICSLTLTAAAQWNTQAWARSMGFRNTNAMWATIHSFTVTNETSPGVFAVTNETWRSWISYTNFTTNTINSTFTIKSLRWANGVPTNFAYTVSDSKTLVQTNLVQTWQDQIQLDCALALDERIRSLPYWYNNPSEYFSPVRLYFNAQQNLVYLKDALYYPFSTFNFLDGMPQWISESYFSNRVSAGALYLSNAHEMVWQGGLTFSTIWFGTTTTNNDIAVAASVPSNYLLTTFYRDLFYTNSIYAHVMTCSVKFADSFAGVTNITITDCCGNTNVAVSGTNRQVVALVCTNASIAAGYTAADYNYYGLRRILTNMTLLLHFMQDEADVVMLPAAGGDWRQYQTTGGHSTNNNAGVDARAVAFGSMALTGTNTTWTFNDQYSTASSNGSTISAGAVIADSIWTFTIWSNPFVHEVTWYASATKGGYTTFDDMGTGISNRADLVAYRMVSVTGDVSAGLAFATTSTISLARFAQYNTSSGMVFNAPIWVSRPQGFKFK